MKDSFLRDLSLELRSRRETLWIHLLAGSGNLPFIIPAPRFQICKAKINRYTSLPEFKNTSQIKTLFPSAIWAENFDPDLKLCAPARYRVRKLTFLKVLGPKYRIRCKFKRSPTSIKTQRHPMKTTTSPNQKS